MALGNQATISIGIDVDTKTGKVKLREFGDELDKTGKKGATSFSGMSGALQKFKTGLSPMQGILAGIGATFGVWQLTRVTQDIIKVGSAFKQNIATVGGIANATTDELRMMEDAARFMGETTEWSASQAADALKFLAMAGFDAERSVKALPNVLDLATAGNIDLGRAADIASNALTAMRLPVDELNRVNDVFVKTITSSNTNMEMMAESFKYSAPVAAGYGMEIETLSAMIGMLGNAGIQGSMAGTQLAAAFGDANKVFAKYRVSTVNADGSTKDLVDAIELLEKNGASAGEIMDIFGERSGRAMLALQGQGTAALRSYIGEVENSSGATKNLADIMRNTFGGELKTLQSTLESLKIDLFEQYEDQLRETLNKATGWLRDHKDEIIAFVGEGTNAAKQFAEDLKPLAESVGGFAKHAISGFLAWPTWAQEVGIVGAIIGGKTGAAVFVGYLALWNKVYDMSEKYAEQSNRFQQQLDSAIARRKQFDEANSKPIDVPMPDAGETSATFAEALAKVDAAAKETTAAVNKSAAEASAAVDKSVKEQSAAVKKGEESKRKESGLTAKEEKKLLDEFAKAYKKAADEEQKNALGKYEYQRKLVLRQAEEYKEAGEDEVRVAEWVARELEGIRRDEAEDEKKKNDESRRDTEKLASDRASAYRTMFSDMGRMTQENYEYQKQALDEEYAKYVELTGKKELADAAYTQRLRQLDIQKLESSDNMMNGVRAGLLRLSDDWETWGQRTSQIVMATSQAARKSLSDGLFAAMKGDMDDAKSAWQGFWDSLLRIAADATTNLVVDWAEMGISSLFSKWHTGNMNVANEQMAILEVGEMVLDKASADLFRKMLETTYKGVTGQDAPTVQVRNWLQNKGPDLIDRTFSLGKYAPLTGEALTAVASSLWSTGTSPIAGMDIAEFGSVQDVAEALRASNTTIQGGAVLQAQGMLNAGISPIAGMDVAEFSSGAMGAQEGAAGLTGGIQGIASMAGNAAILYVATQAGFQIGKAIGEAIFGKKDPPHINATAVGWMEPGAGHSATVSGMGINVGQDFAQRWMDEGAAGIARLYDEMTRMEQILGYQLPRWDINVGYGGSDNHPTGWDINAPYRYGLEYYGAAMGRNLAGAGFRFGGLSRGPDSGYMQLLHGDEWVVPDKLVKAIAAEAPGTGKIGGGRTIEINAPLIQVDGNLIADEHTFTDFAGKLANKLYELEQLEN